MYQFFMDDCQIKGQKYNYSGTGAHHQNDVTEQSIQTFHEWERTMLLQAAVH